MWIERYPACLIGPTAYIRTITISPLPKAALIMGAFELRSPVVKLDNVTTKTNMRVAVNSTTLGRRRIFHQLIWRSVDGWGDGVLFVSGEELLSSLALSTATAVVIANPEIAA